MKGQAVESTVLVVFTSVQWAEESVRLFRASLVYPQKTQKQERTLHSLLIGSVGLLCSHENEVHRLFSFSSYDPWMSFPPFAFTQQQPSGCASSLWCGKMSWACYIQLGGCFDWECFWFNRHLILDKTWTLRNPNSGRYWLWKDIN